MHLGIHLRTLLEERNKTGQELANSVGVSKSYISSVLSGKGSLSPEKAQELLTEGLAMAPRQARHLVVLWQLQGLLLDNPDVLPAARELLDTIDKAPTGAAGVHISHNSGSVVIGNANKIR